MRQLIISIRCFICLEGNTKREKKFSWNWIVVAIEIEFRPWTQNWLRILSSLKLLWQGWQHHKFIHADDKELLWDHTNSTFETTLENDQDFFFGQHIWSGLLFWSALVIRTFILVSTCDQDFFFGQHSWSGLFFWSAYAISTSGFKKVKHLSPLWGREGNQTKLGSEIF